MTPEQQANEIFNFYFIRLQGYLLSRYKTNSN